MAPLTPIAGEDLARLLATIQPDLRQQLTSAGVPELVQAHIAQANYCSISKFHVFAFDMPGVLLTCKRLGLDPDENIQNMTDAASVALAWRTCMQIHTVHDTHVAEKKVSE